MQPNLNTAYQTTSMVGSSNRVLRNTYALLALSLIPTVIGAVIGTTVIPMSMMSFIVLAIASYALMFAVQANRYSGLGVGLMLLFTFVMGAMLGPLLRMALHLSNGAQLVLVAGGATSAVFFVMAGIATTTKKDLTGLAKFLTVGLVVVIIAMLANLFLHIPALHLTICTAIALISSLLILWEVKNVVDGGETSYISAALSIYVSLYNLFSSLLQLLIALAGDRR